MTPGAAFLDTNVLVRYLTDDPPELAARAEAIIEKENLVLNSVVLMESVYVLWKQYGLPREEVVDTLVDFLQRENVTMLDMPKEYAASALLSLKERAGVTLGDALIVAAMRAGGVERIYSFDRGLKAEGITVLRDA